MPGTAREPDAGEDVLHAEAARGTIEVRVRCADPTAVLHLVDVLRAHGRR